MGESKIVHKVLDLLERVLNPATGKDLFVEKRVLDVKADNHSCCIVLNGQGLSSDIISRIQGNIVKQLEGVYSPQAIEFSMNSSSSATPRPSEKDPAQLRVGHEQQSESKKRLPSVQNLIAIASGKGGVGKSAFTANLALALKQKGLRVGVVDADIYGPSLPMIFGQRGARPIASKNKKIIPIQAFGVDLMSFGFFVEEKDPVIWRGPMLGGVINQFLFDVEWPELDYLLIDMPPGTGDIQLSLSQMIELTGAIIVSTPQDIALLDTKKGLKMFQKMNVPILGMVQNMSYFVGDDHKKYYLFGRNGVEEVARSLEVPFLGKVPLEIPLREGSDQGVPYMSQEKYRGRGAWEAFVSIAEKLSYSDPEEKARKKGLWGRLF